ncbi:MAG: oligosaccharide flippase family protein [Candidatus Aureabacteria bacterium]|nr:oligosaccharide flippase family protein [Candidatus Auribacterota bacterium]
MKKRILLNIFSNNVGRVFEMILGLALVPFLIRSLGLQGFGLIILAESLIEFFDMAFNGFRLALGRYVGFYLVQDKHEESNAYIASGEVILFGIIAIASAIGFIIWVFFTRLFTVPVEFAQGMRVLFILLIVSYLLRFRFTPAWAVIYSKQRFDLVNIYIGFRNLTRFFLCFLIYGLFPPKLYYYGWIYLAAVMVEQVLILRGAKKLFPNLKIRIKDASFAKIKELFYFMSAQTVGSLGQMLYARTDMILINRFFGPSFNSIYSISLKFVSILKRLISRSFWGVAPTFTELVSKKDFKRVGRIYSSLTKASALISIPACILLGFYGKELVFLWVGEKFKDAIVPMYIHIIGLLPGLVFACSGGVLLAFCKIKIPSLVTLFCAILNVILSILFALHFKMGLAGFALGSLAATFFQTLGFIPYYTCRIAGIPYLKFYINSFIKPLILCGVFGLSLYYLKFIIEIPFLIVASAIFICGILYFILAYIFIFSAHEKSLTQKTIFSIYTKMKEVYR